MSFLDLSSASEGVATGQVMIELQKVGARSVDVVPDKRIIVRSILIGAMAFEHGIAAFTRKSTYWFVRISIAITVHGKRDLDARSHGRISMVPARSGRYTGQITGFNVHNEQDLQVIIDFLFDGFGNERKERPVYNELVKRGVLNHSHYQPPP